MSSTTTNASPALDSFMGIWLSSTEYFFSTSISEWRSGTLVGVRCTQSSAPRKVLLISSDDVNKSLMLINRNNASDNAATTITLVLHNLDDAPEFTGSIHKVVYHRAGPTVAIANRDYEVGASMGDGFIAVLVPESTRTDPHIATHARFSLLAEGGSHRTLNGGWIPTSTSTVNANDLCVTGSPVHMGDDGSQSTLDLFVLLSSTTNSKPGSEETSKSTDSMRENTSMHSEGISWGGDLLVWVIIGLTLLVYGSYLMKNSYQDRIGDVL